MSFADWGWRLFTLLIIGGGGTTGGYLASESVFFSELGPLAWLAIGIISSLLVAILFYLIKSADNKSAQAEYTRTVSQPKKHVNPLLDSFKDLIIPVEELRVPGVQVHENKHFKRCHFVGPAAIAILGGNYVSTSFNEVGDIIPLPDNTYLTGIIVLKNCTVEECTFYRTTLMVGEAQALAMSESVPGMRVAGA